MVASSTIFGDQMSLQLKNNILRDIDTVARESHSIYEAKFKNHNLQRGQFIFLTRICENPGINLKELSYKLKMDKTTVTKAIQKLIIAGYISKNVNKQDNRIANLTPTDKAIKMYDEIISEKNRIIDICLNGITHEEFETLNNLIKTMLHNINKEWEKLINIK